MRLGEAFALHWDDLDFTNRKILVESGLSAGIVGTTKTGGRPNGRHVPGTRSRLGRVIQAL